MFEWNWIKEVDKRDCFRNQSIEIILRIEYAELDDLDYMIGISLETGAGIWNQGKYGIARQKGTFVHIEFEFDGFMIQPLGFCFLLID